MIQEVKIDGMSCSHCERQVSEILSKLPKVELARADASKGIVMLEVKEPIPFADIEDAVNQSGIYTAKP